MTSAKDIRVAPIISSAADEVVKRFHYSGKVVNNSQLHLGVFLGDRLLGAMQFGPSLDKRKVGALVRDTGWNDFIELNRMAFSDELPRNSESRALAVALRMLRANAPHIKWVVSFADAAQCGDGTIYRASGFVLTGIKRNTQVWAAPSGETFSRTSLTDGRSKQQQARQVVSRVTMTKAGNMVNGAASMKAYAEAGFRPLEGYQLRYVYLLDPAFRPRLTVAEIPFSMIGEMGASMYRGEKLDARRRTDLHSDGAGKNSPDGTPVGEGGVTPTPALVFPPDGEDT